MRRALIIGMVLFGVSGFLVLGLIITDSLRPPAQTIETDILVYGSGLGGTSAAITAADQGAKVVLATESAAIGGQAVEAGLSAFDDLGKSWEQWGLYLDLQKYLREKWDTTDEDHAGLGKTVVGRVASIPTDIEDFFRARITSQKNITLLTKHALLTLHRQRWLWGQWREADLLDLQTQKRLRVRFQYLVDGTPTGQVLARTQTPFRLGFDAQEETGERYALTTDQRRSFVEGVAWKDKRLEGLGSRVQAINSPFALLDRGYPGEFFPVSTPTAACRSPATASGFIVGSTLFAIGNPACLARIPVNPEFTDTYDMYLVHHGSGLLDGTISSLHWADQPITLTLALPDDTFTYLGTFPAAPHDGMTIAVSADSSPILIEGVILVKRNMAPADPLVFRSPLPGELTLKELEVSPIIADLYITGTNVQSTEHLTLDEHPLTPLTAGPQTLIIPDIPLHRESVFTLPSSLRSSGTSLLIIIPKAPSITTLTFLGDKPDREIPASSLEEGSTLSRTVLPIREWSFVAHEDGNAVFLIQSDATDRWPLELWTDEPAQRTVALSFTANNVSRSPRPLFTVPLSKGKRYRLRIAIPEGGSWSSFSWSIAFSQSSALAEAAGSTGLTLPPGSHAGIYDIWIKAPVPSTALCILERPQGTGQRWSITVRHRQYNYVGKAHLDHTTTLSSPQTGTSLLAIPNTNIDTFLSTLSPSVPTSALTFATLPPGRYRVLLRGNTTAPARLSVSLAGTNSSQSLSFPAQTTPPSPLLSPDPFSNNGQPLTLTLPQGVSSLQLFEEIPDLQDSWTFTMSHHPLTGNSDQEPVPLFRFRNIVAPAPLMKGVVGSLTPKLLGRNSAGVTLVVNPSNDYASVRAEDIDSENLVEASRARSAAYAYWMRYDAALTQPNLGCDPMQFSCTPKRTRLVIGIFEDPLSPFPPRPYQRESRRLLSSRIVRYDDLAPTFATCNHDTCPQDCQQIPALPQFCLPKTQEPLLFSDALAAVGYAIDIHAFYSLSEYYEEGRDFFSALREKFGGATPPILLPVWRMIYSRPAEVPLSALLARDGGNVFPAANNMGISQIANGLYRTHVSEMATGQAVGSLLSAAIKNGVPPSAFGHDQIRSLQHALVERGGVLYPIVDMMTDAALRTSTQHLIVEGLLAPTAMVHPKVVFDWDTITYNIFPLTTMNDQDSPIVQALFPSSAPQSLTYRHLLSRLASTTPQTSDDNLRQHGLAEGLIDMPHRKLPTEKLLRSTPSKGDLYRAAGLLLHDRWLGEEQ